MEEDKLADLQKNIDELRNSIKEGEIGMDDLMKMTKKMTETTRPFSPVGRLDEWIEKKGINREMLCFKLGLDQVFFKRPLATLNWRHIKMLMEYYPELNIVWLMVGIGGMDDKPSLHDKRLAYGYHLTSYYTELSLERREAIEFLHVDNEAVLEALKADQDYLTDWERDELQAYLEETISMSRKGPEQKKATQAEPQKESLKR